MQAKFNFELISQDEGARLGILTTAFGLIVAMIIQIAQNFFSSMIDGMVLDMEERSIEITDLLRDSK